MQLKLKNRTKAIRSFLIIVCIAVASYFIIGTLLLITGIGDMYVGDSFDWNELLNDENKKYSISCEDGIYMLTFSPSDEKSKTSGVFIGSSAKDLQEFCGKEVQIQATGRAFYGKPLCTEQLKQEKSEFCNGRRHVIDIQEINSVEKM